MGQAPQNSELAERCDEDKCRSTPPILNSAVPDPASLANRRTRLVLFSGQP